MGGQKWGKLQHGVRACNSQFSTGSYTRRAACCNEWQVRPLRPAMVTTTVDELLSPQDLLWTTPILLVVVNGFFLKKKVQPVTHLEPTENVHLVRTNSFHPMCRRHIHCAASLQNLRAGSSIDATTPRSICLGHLSVASYFQNHPCAQHCTVFPWVCRSFTKAGMYFLGFRVFVLVLRFRVVRVLGSGFGVQVLRGRGLKF